MCRGSTIEAVTLRAGAGCLLSEGLVASAGHAATTAVSDGLNWLHVGSGPGGLLRGALPRGRLRLNAENLQGRFWFAGHLAEGLAATRGHRVVWTIHYTEMAVIRVEQLLEVKSKLEVVLKSTFH